MLKLPYGVSPKNKNGTFLLRNFAKFCIFTKMEKGFVISTGALVFKIPILVGLVHRAM